MVGHTGNMNATIKAIETGKFDPSLTLSIKITRFFKKGLEEIFTMEEE